MNRSSGGPPPQGNGSRPVYSCPVCQTMYSGGRHVCRQADPQTEPPEPEAGS